MAVISTVTLEFAILILPSLFGSNGLHDVQVLGDLAVFNAPQIIVGSGSAAEGSLGNRQHVVALSQHLMDRIIDHLDALLGESTQRSAETGEPIGNAGVVLNVGVAVEVGGRLFGRMTPGLFHFLR